MTIIREFRETRLIWAPVGLFMLRGNDDLGFAMRAHYFRECQGNTKHCDRENAKQQAHGFPSPVAHQLIPFSR